MKVFVSILILLGCLSGPIFTTTDLVGPVDSVRFKDGQKWYRRNCAVCHSAKKDQKLISESLANILEKRDTAWVVNYSLSEKKFMEKERGEYYRKDGLDEDHEFAYEMSKENMRNLVYFIRTPKNN